MRSAALGWLVIAALVSCLDAPAAAGMADGDAGVARAAPDQVARDLFRAQRYAEALAIYQRLRAETRHPTYLRNIGRCHQMLRQPAPAVDAFTAYLREAPGLDAAERAEIDGYIADMRRLELAAPPPPASSSPPAAVTVAPPAAASGAGESPSLARRWWFWAGLGALAVATTVVIMVGSGQDRLACPGGAVCP